MFIPVDIRVVEIVIDNGDIFIPDSDDVDKGYENDIDEPEEECDDIEPADGNRTGKRV
jgi:hypothetical protein